MPPQLSSKLLRLIITGTVSALALQTVATVVLLTIQNNGREVAAASIGSGIIAASLGFAVIARNLTGRQAALIGIVYFPTVLGLMLMEAVYFDVRIYGNTF